MRHFAILTVLFLMITASHAATSNAPLPPAPPAATKMLALFDRLRDAPSNDVPGNRQVAFTLSESDVNEYLRYALKTTPRPGVNSVSLKFFPNGYLSTFTVIDFDAVEKWHPGLIPTVLRPVLKGEKSVWIDCRIQATDSRLTFTIEKARYNDMPLPAFFAEKMIQLIAARQPEKYDTSQPLPLPFGLIALSTREHLVQGHN